MVRRPGPTYAPGGSSPRLQRPVRIPPTAQPPRFERRNLDLSLANRLGSDAYHLLRNTDWLRLTGFFAVVYLALNLLFATILWVGGADILNAQPGFEDWFVFSVQTMATIGYGYLAPNDWLAHLVVTTESFVSIVFNAVVTGVFFGKFATPSARVLFSEICVIADEEGVPNLMFRCANARATALVEATVKVALTHEVILAHGYGEGRRIHDLSAAQHVADLRLVLDRVPPDRRAEPAVRPQLPGVLAAAGTNLIVTLTGIDDSLAATVHTRMTYGADKIRFGQRFVDVIGMDVDGSRYIDFARFHDTVELRRSALGTPRYDARMKTRATSLYPFVPSGPSFDRSIAFFEAIGFTTTWAGTAGSAGLRFVGPTSCFRTSTSRCGKRTRC